MLNCTVEQVNVTLEGATTDLIRATTFKLLEFNMTSLLLFFMLLVAMYAIFDRFAKGISYGVLLVCTILSIPFYVYKKWKATHSPECKEVKG